MSSIRSARTRPSGWRPPPRCTPPRPAPSRRCSQGPQYPGHLLVRRVSKAGTFRFHGHQLFLSDTLMEEDIALEEVDDGVWSIFFYDVLVARLDERDYRGSSG